MSSLQVETKTVPRGSIRNIVQAVREEYFLHVQRNGFPSAEDYKRAINTWLMDGVMPSDFDRRAIPL